MATAIASATELQTILDKLSNWKTQLEKLVDKGDTEDFAKAAWLINFVDSKLTPDSFSKAGRDGGFDSQELNDLFKKLNNSDKVDRLVHFDRNEQYPFPNEKNNPVYVEGSFKLGNKRKKELNGPEFLSLSGVLTDQAQLKKVFLANGIFCTVDDPKLSVLISEGFTRLIDWAKKDHVNKAVDARKAKIAAFYETLKPTLDDLRVSYGEKITSYRIAAEFNKMNIATYTQSGHWMPNMVDRMLKTLAKNNPD